MFCVAELLACFVRETLIPDTGCGHAKDPAHRVDGGVSETLDCETGPCPGPPACGLWAASLSGPAWPDAK